MPWYDFKCPNCNIVRQVQMSMSEAGNYIIYCVDCTDLTEEQKKEAKWFEYGLPVMARLYSNNVFVKGNNLGSLLETKKFRSTNARPTDWHDEQIKNKQRENQEKAYREIKIKDV